MGGKHSSFKNLATNEYILKYAGVDSIVDVDSYWQEFLGFNRISDSDYTLLEKLDEYGSDVLQNFRKNNKRSHNLSSLMKFIISEGTQLLGTASSKDCQIDKKSLTLVQNALLVFRLSSKYLLAQTTEQQFLGHLADGSVEIFSSCPILETFFHVLFNLMLGIPVGDFSYAFHCETLMSILTLLARQMHREISSPLPLVYAYLMWGKCASLAPAIVQRLLQNFADNTPPPPGILGFPAQSSFVWRAASSLAGGLLTVVTLGYANRGHSAKLHKPAPEDSTVASPVTDLISSESASLGSGQDLHLLANLSSLLLLVLTTQAGSIMKCTTLLEQLGLNPQTPTLNPYRVALFSVNNSNDSAPTAQPTVPPKDSGIPDSGTRESTATLRGVTSTSHPDAANYPIDFLTLRDTASVTLHQDSSTLLLYLLIYRNVHFQSFLMDQRNYDKLLLPLLNILYRSPGDSSHLVYMALIMILMWSENDRFSEEIHTSTINWVTWSPSRHLSAISRGSLVILVLLRTVRYHLNQLKDKYLHVNILAALANLSSRVKNLHPYVSESFLHLLQLMARRYNRTVDELRRVSTLGKGKMESVDTAASGNNHDSAGATVSAGLAEEDALTQELSLLEEVVRMVLEILNSILTHSLLHNPNLIYSLLYGRDCLTALRSHPSFQNVIQNIDTILAYFTSKITQDLGENPTSPADLLAVINKYSPSFNRSCNLRKFPELKFKYVEEESPDEFFIPYVWSIVVRQSGMLFQTGFLPLFCSEAGLADAVASLDVTENHHQENNASVAVNGAETNHT